MKIAFVIPGFVPVPDVLGGAVERLITYLIDQNEIQDYFEIDLYTIDHPKLKELNYNNTNVHKIKLNKIELFYDRVVNHFFHKFNLEKSINCYCRKALKKIKKINYDYILIENNMYIYKSLYSKLNKNCPNTKFIYHLHNDIGKLDKPYSLCKYILSTADIVITCSDFLKKRLSSTYSANNIYTLYNVIDFNRMKYSESARKIIRDYYAVSDNFVFGYVGRISEEKGTLELIKAFKKVYKNNKNAKLMIIGDTLFKNSNNKYFNKFRDEVDSLGDAIIYTGSVDNLKINEYMSALDVLIIPTICEEAFGIVAAEGLACERPIIATKSGGMTEVINEDIATIIDKNNIITELESNMKKVIDDYEFYLEKARNGRKLIFDKKTFFLENYLDNFYKIITKNEGDKK